MVVMFIKHQNQYKKWFKAIFLSTFIQIVKMKYYTMCM
jgi:hypothetical protein